ncbi:MAG: hypothetical protein PWP23_3193 [Candidatus Sumerlaeota bacterium]|nr:hypothetical protein [Candidatus Sumerlaeota bacterium]
MSAKHRIMIVDDDADIRELLKASLGSEFEVFGARNGCDALVKLTKYEPDLAIVDIMMPLMNGHELIRKIRGTDGFARLPVLALSALNQRSDIKKGYEAGADFYLTKPFQPERLQRSVRHLLEERPPTPKQLTIEEVETRERIQEAHLQRALRKKKGDTTRDEDTVREENVTTARDENVTTVREETVRDEAPYRTPSPNEERTTPPRPLRVPTHPVLKGHASATPPSGSRTDVRRSRSLTPPPDDGREPRAKERLSSGEHRLPEVPQPRILLVDDDDDFRVITRGFLEEYYEVVTAHDGFDALNKIPDIEPDIFIIDAMMPKMSGFQLIDTLRGANETRNKPIIFCSARGSERDRKLVAQKGVPHFIVKPFPPEKLLAVLEEIVSADEFIIADKKQTFRELMYEEGVRRAAHMTLENRKQRWDTYTALEKFLKDTVRKEPE